MRSWLPALAVTALGAAFCAAPALAQLDLTPPGATAPRQQPRRAAPSQPRAPRSAPLPLPRPDIAEAPATPEAAAPPAETATAPSPPPAAAAPPAEGAASRIDDAFRAAASAQPETPIIPAQPAPAARPAEPEPAPPPADAPANAALAAVDPPRADPPFAVPPPVRMEGRAYPETRYPVGRQTHLPVIVRHAQELRVPIDLADAVATIESAYDPHAVGTADEIGLMQVRTSTARQLGFEGTVQELFEPQTNIRLGLAYLAGAWERAGGNLCQALMKYRAGWDETRMSALSWEYCRRALTHLTAIRSPLAQGVVLPSTARGAAPGALPSGRFNWRDHENRLRQIDRSYGGQNFGIIAR